MAKGRDNKKNFKDKPQSEFEQRIIDLARVTRVMAGGKRMRFRACVAIGDGKGKVGWGVAKGADVAIAVNKAVFKAKKNMYKIRLVDGTIPHKVEAKFKASKVMLKPAVEGTGIIAGGAVRQVLELAGIPNIYGKLMGANNKISNLQATFKALKSLKYYVEPEEYKEEAVEAKPVERDLEKEEELEEEQKRLLRKEGLTDDDKKALKL